MNSQQLHHHDHQTNHRRTTALEHHQAVHYLVDKACLKTHPVPLMNPQVGHHSIHPNKYYHSLIPPPTTPSSGSQINPSAKPFIPAATAPKNVPSSPQQNIPRSTNGEGVKRSRQQGKSNGQDERLCFCCKQPEHLKSDCPELPYCSKCRTKGHVPARCPTKQQDAGQVPEGLEFHGPNHESSKLCRDEWKRAQDQPRFSNPDNRCLNCAGKHATHDCPTRHQHQAPTTSNPASGSGIYKSKSNPNISSPPNSSPPQNSQQSQSTVGVTTPTVMVNNLPRQPGPTTGPNQLLQYPTQHFNPHFLQPSSSQVSPLVHLGQPFNPHIPPPYFPQYTPNSPSMGSEASYLAVIHKQLERQEKQDRERNEIE